MNKYKTKIFYYLILILILLGGIVLVLLPISSLIIQSIGTSLIASGIISLLDIWYSSITDFNKEKTNRIINSGLLQVHNHRDIDKYHPMIDNLSDKLDISGYSLRNFYESFHDTLIQRISNSKQLQIRILVVDPKCFYSINREQKEKHSKGTFENQLVQMKDFFQKYSNNIHIRKLNGELTTMVFRIDNCMFVGPYFSSKPSKSTVTYEFVDSRDSWLFKEYEKEFEELWIISSTVL